MSRRILRVALSALGFLAVAAARLPPAAAQAVAAANALFQTGVAAMNAGRFAVACPALAESLRLDPRPGTLFTLAECENMWGHVASAAARYDEYLRLLNHLPPAAQRTQLQLQRDKRALSEKARLGPLVPLVTITLSPSAPQGARVFLDGVELARPSLDTALPLDPGEHVLLVEAPDRSTSEQRLQLAEKDRKNVIANVPGPAPKQSGAPAPAEATKDPGKSAHPESPPAPPRAISTVQGPPQPLVPRSSPLGLRVGAYIVGGVGVAALGAGILTGALTLAKKRTIEAHCRDIFCDDEGLAASQSARPLGAASTAGFAVGLGAIGVGITMFTLSSALPNASPSIKTGFQWGIDLMGAKGAMTRLEGQW